MTSIYDLFSTDRASETEGVWIDYGEFGRFKLARAGGSNKAYIAALQKMFKEHRHQIDTDTMSDDVAEKKTREIFCKHVLLSWEGVKGKTGRNLAHSHDAAVQLMTDLPDLYSDLRAQAQKISNFRAEAMEADAKNSEPSSAGS